MDASIHPIHLLRREMKNIEIGNHKNLSADKRGWQLKKY